jgi:hypothetical protein
MSNKKNIDRLFQEKFKDFEAVPNDAVWNRINESLPNKKKKRRVVALWWQIGGVAAVIALMLTAGVSIFNSDDNNSSDLPIVNTDKTDSETNSDKNINSKQNELNNAKDVEKIKFVDTENDVIIEEQENIVPKKDNVSNQLINSNNYQQKSNEVANNSNEKEKTNTSQKSSDLTTVIKKDNSAKVALNTKTSNSNSKNSDATELTNDKELKSAIKKTIEEHKTTVAENSSSNKSDSENSNTESKNSDELKVENSIIEDLKKQDIKDAIAENTIDEKEKEDEQDRWSIAPNVAPVYYSSLGQGSSVGEQFNSNTKSSDINMSYGITGSYAITKRLKVRTGVSQVNLSQSTSDVYAFTGPSISTLASRTSSIPIGGNITFNNNLPIASLMSAKLMQMPESSSPVKSGDLDQRFGFIEVPLELEYRIVDKKFGINVIGGFSTFFLNQNEIYADLHGTSTLIGEANNINSTSYSANLGLGLDYSLSKQLNINLEPTFKYQINTFNNTSGNFNPFFVGVYTGLSFKF